MTLAGCSQQTAAPTPVEQLPNPDFDRKPQIFFVIDESEVFFNLPIAGEIDLKQRSRLSLFRSMDLAALEDSLREFNSREGDLLVFSGRRLLPAAKKLGVFSHPSGRKTFYFDAGLPVQDAGVVTLKLDLASLRQTFAPVCSRWSKDLDLSCEWDAGIPGGVPAAPSAGPKSIRLSFKTDEASSRPPLLKIDWVQWIEQFLMNHAKPGVSATWQTLSLDQGTLRIEVPDSEDMAPARKILQEERLKNL